MNKTLFFEEEFMRCEPKRNAILCFMREAIGTNKVQWDDINPRNMSSVKKLITERCSGNTPQTYFAILKSFFKKYEDYIPCKFDPGKQLKAKRMPSQNVFLTEEEIGLIEQYAERLNKRKGHQEEKDVVNAFLIECFCGARGIDVENFTDENIINGNLVYISQKTKVMSKVPIHPKIASRLLHKPSKAYSNATKDRIIKRVARFVGIDDLVTIMYRGKMQTRPKYEYVGFHTARRSFCSNLAKRGVDIYTIASLANHAQNITMTQRYIIPDVNELSQEALSFFKGD